MLDPGFAIAGLVVGFAVGATGVGGGSLMTPALILFYGVSPAIAVGTDLFYSAISKSFAATLLGRRNSIDWKLVGWLSIGSLPAAAASVWATRILLPPAELASLIQSVLAIAIVLTAVFTLVQEPVLKRLHTHTDNHEPNVRLQRGFTVAGGALIGGLVGVSSVGAGVIGMALLMLLYPKHKTVTLIGSDLVHAVLVSGIAGAGHAAVHDVNYSMLVALVLGSIPGIWLGTRVALRFRDRALKRSVAAILLLVGVTTLAHAAIG
ncbi:MAG: sulfite exporter TauE/SafE family protein [Sinobacteraceae bacterium]|nr:sulfite exporter TauE/SafE family protein [Nevskiaceae bacterium]